MPNFRNVEALFGMENSDNSINAGSSGTPSSDQILDLKKIRESKGLTLREISRITRISHTVLAMIEIEKFEALPEPIYATAFIRTYAEALGADGEEILYRYSRYLKEQELSGKKDEVNEKSWMRSRSSLVVWGVVAIAAVVAFVFYVVQQDHAGKERPVTEEAVQETSVVPPSEPPETTVKEETTIQPAPAPEPEPAPPVAAEEEAVFQPTVEAVVPGEAVVETTVTEERTYRLTITARELTWLKIARDGGESSEILLQPGEKLDREAREGFVVVVGNAGGVDVVFDGESLGRLGEHGEVVSLDLPQERSD